MAQMHSLRVLYLTVCFSSVLAKRVKIHEVSSDDVSSAHNDTSERAEVSYKELAEASAYSSSSFFSFGSSETDITVAFGEKSFGRQYKAYLTREGVNAQAFKDVSWQEPDPSGLTESDLYYIDKYTGRFDYSRNIGVVLRGITPYTEREDPANKYAEQSDHAKLALEVLKWAVRFGTAINRLPVLQQARPLWRGAWESKSQLSSLLPGMRTGVPWFQPVSSDESYAPTFLQIKYQPNVCKEKGCIETDHSFPVLYEFHTAAARDLTEWNPKESEFMVLPNTAFKVKSVVKVINDKFLEMDNAALVAWLQRDDHRPVDPKEDKRFGPWTLLAEKVQEKGWTGTKLIEEYDSGYFTRDGPYDYHLRYLANLGIDDEDYPYELQSQLTLALRNRFKLPPVKAERFLSVVGNSVPFYYKITQEDA